jgi:hypothetical protein
MLQEKDRYVRVEAQDKTHQTLAIHWQDVETELARAMVYSESMIERLQELEFHRLLIEDGKGGAYCLDMSPA